MIRRPPRSTLFPYTTLSDLRRHDVLRAPGRRALRADQRVHDAPEREDVARRPPAGAAAALDVLHQADQDERGALRTRGREPETLRVGDRPVALAVNQDQTCTDLAHHAQRRQLVEVALERG